MHIMRTRCQSTLRAPRHPSQSQPASRPRRQACFCTHRGSDGDVRNQAVARRAQQEH